MEQRELNQLFSQAASVIEQVVLRDPSGHSWGRSPDVTAVSFLSHPENGF